MRRAIVPRASHSGSSMKILVVSDIHANWVALQAIEESFDACLFLRDLLD